MKSPARGLRVWNAVEAGVAATAFGCATLLLIADVLSREITNQSILGAPQVAVMFSVVASFLGFGIATAKGTHLRPQVLDGLFPAAWSRNVDRASDLTAAAAFFFFGAYAVVFVMESYEFGDRAAVLYVPLWPLQSVIAYALIACGVRHVIYAAWPDLRPRPTMEGADIARDLREGKA